MCLWLTLEWRDKDSRERRDKERVEERVEERQRGSERESEAGGMDE